MRPTPHFSSYWNKSVPASKLVRDPEYANRAWDELIDALRAKFGYDDVAGE